MKDSNGIITRLDTKIPGCYEVQPVIRRDNRGMFVKTIHEGAFKELGLEDKYTEVYHSLSYKNVLRGLHFQIPPAAHAKLVGCIVGSIMDVAVDLRCNSPTYGKHHSVILEDESFNMLYIPKGCAHGFYTLSKQAIVIYHVTTVYDSKLDKGVLWNSAGISWPTEHPIVSARDETFPALRDFFSPFFCGA